MSVMRNEAPSSTITEILSFENEQNSPIFVERTTFSQVKFFKILLWHILAKSSSHALKNFVQPLCYINNAKLDKVQFDLEIEVQGH